MDIAFTVMYGYVFPGRPTVLLLHGGSHESAVILGHFLFFFFPLSAGRGQTVCITCNHHIIPGRVQLSLLDAAHQLIQYY